MSNPCPPRARKEVPPRRFTVIHGATGSTPGLCDRRSCGCGHLLCKQGVRGSSPLSSTSTRQNVLVAILVLGARAINVPLARLCQRSSRAVVVIVRPVIGGLCGSPRCACRANFRDLGC
jgi:hypothetical protein